MTHPYNGLVPRGFSLIHINSILLVAVIVFLGINYTQFEEPQQEPIVPAVQDSLVTELHADIKALNTKYAKVIRSYSKYDSELARYEDSLIVFNGRYVGLATSLQDILSRQMDFNMSVDSSRAATIFR